MKFAGVKYNLKIAGIMNDMFKLNSMKLTEHA